jgi:hypothetical protein
VIGTTTVYAQDVVDGPSGTVEGTVSHAEETGSHENKGGGFWEWLAGLPETIIIGPIGTTVMTVNGVLLQAIAIPVLSILFRISAAMLDHAVIFTLSTDIFKTTSSGVSIVWSIIRDICNIAFIFILLWSSIQMILGLSSGKTKKMVADVVIAALLINFSMFITRVLIDAGNILGVAIYEKIQSGPLAGEGLGAILMQSLGLSSIFETIQTATSGGKSFFSVHFGMISYLQVITLLTAFIVFMYAMLLMATRIVVLIFLIVMSPIGFMGNVLPKLSEYSKEWRETLYGQVMIAPIFLLFVYLIIKVSTAFNNIVPELIGPAKGSDDPTQYMSYFRYVMVIMLLVVAVKITKKMTGVVGKLVEGAGKTLGTAAVGLAMGGVGFALRGTIGRGANALATSQGLKDWSVSDSIAKRWSAKATMAIGGGVAKRSFDARNISAVSSLAKEHLGVDIKEGAFGTKFGSAGKGGYAGRISEQQKAGEEKAKMLSEGIMFSKEQIATGVANKKAEIEGKITERDSLRARKDSLNDVELAELRKLEATIKTYASLSNDEYAEKIEGELIYAKKKERLEAAAKVEEGVTRLGKIANSMLGGKKERAKKLREAYKKPSKEKALAEAVKAQAKETAEETTETEKTKAPPAAPAGGTSAPSAGGGTTH